MTIRTILYLGDDEEFLKQVHDYALSHLRMNYEVLSRPYFPGRLIEDAIDNEPNIILLETSDHLSELSEELRMLRKLKRMKPVFAAFICKDTEQVRQVDFLLAGGVQLFFIKGHEVNYFMRDCLYMGLEEKVYHPSFATAANLYLKLQVGMLSTITATNNNSILVETDLELGSEEKVSLSLRYLLDMPAPFETSASFRHSVIYPMLECYDLKYPIVGPWDEVRVDNLQQETIDTWLDASKDRFDQRKKFISVFSSDLKVVGDLSVLKKLPFYVDFYEEIEDFLSTGDSAKRPTLYFYALQENSNEVDAINDISYLIQEIKKIPGYRPIIVMFNSPSTSEALRKILVYNHLMCIPQRLDQDNFRLLTSKLVTKELQVDHDFLFFRPGDSLRICSLMTEVTVTGLTEHEITFFSELDLPLFSVLQFTLPLKFYVTLIPPLKDLPRGGDEKHYMGIIHGIDEEALKDLRKIVNQMIYKPVKEMSPEIVEQMLKQDYLQKPAVISAPALEAVKQENFEVHENVPDKARHKVTRKLCKGRSKL